MNLLLIVVLGSLMQASRSFSTGTEDSGGLSLALGYLLLSAYFVGQICRSLKLPRLTGYIVTGVLAGPAVLGFVSEAMVDKLRIVNGMAIALIALSAGTELELRKMRPYFRSIGWITAVGVCGTAFLLALAVYLGRSQLPFLAGLTQGQVIAVSFVVGTVLTAQSPAVVVALRNELAADGPVARTVLGVVVIADLLVIVLFAVASLVAKAFLAGTADILSTIGALAWEIIGSLVVGSAIGALLALYLRRVREGTPLFILVVVFVIAEVGQRLALDPLLVALAAGILVRNLSTMGNALHAQTQSSAMPVYIAFFAVAGATLHLDALAVMGAPALVLVGIRAVGLTLGSRLGASIAKAELSVRRFAGVGLLPQAGLAIALSLLFTKTFPEFGATASALVLGVVALNELFAPALYRLALVRAGEMGMRRSTTGEIPVLFGAPPPG